MFKYALLAAIAAAADSTDDSSDSGDTKNTYSRSGPAVQDSDSNGLMTSTVGFDITTASDSVTNLSTVGTKLSSGTWGAAGSSKVTTCIKIASDTTTPYECRETMNGAVGGTFIIYNSPEVGPSTTSGVDLICTASWTTKKSGDEYKVTFNTLDLCTNAGVTIDKDTAIKIDSTSWTFAATYSDSSLSADDAKTYSDDLIAGMKDVNVKVELIVAVADDGTTPLQGEKQESIDMTVEDPDDSSSAAALSAFGVALAATYLF